MNDPLIPKNFNLIPQHILQSQVEICSNRRIKILQLYLMLLTSKFPNTDRLYKHITATIILKKCADFCTLNAESVRKFYFFTQTNKQAKIK